MEDCRFGRIEIRMGDRCLLVDGRRVVLGGRAFDLFLALAREPQRVVPRSELYEAVWPGLSVEDNNLAVQVLALRKALGSDAVVTVPGRGYQLGAVGVALAAAAPSPPPSPAPTPAPRAPAPRPPTLIGRETEMVQLRAALRAEGPLTLLGSGGIGKTSLARAAVEPLAERLPGGVVWVDLTTLGGRRRVPGQVARALGLSVSGSGDPLAALAAALAPRELLLVLDNAESFVDEVAVLVEALGQHAPRIRCLVTSQVPLQCTGERLFRLGPLAVPAPAASVSEALSCGAVAMFVALARAADHRFTLDESTLGLVVDLCRRLDGVPMAIRLAAARLPMLGLHGLHARLGERLTLLSDARPAVPDRQRTLNAALDWSHGLLGAAEQALLGRLSVFHGDFGLDPAITVAGDASLGADRVVEAMAVLVDRSLLVVEPTAAPRYRLLETTRAYAVQKLQRSGDEAATRYRLAQAMLTLFAQAERSVWRMGDAVWLDTYLPELDNLRSALDWSAEHDHDVAVRLFTVASRVLRQAGLIAEVHARGAQLDTIARRHPEHTVRAAYWLERAWCVSAFSSYPAGCALACRAARAFREAGDAAGTYLALSCVATTRQTPVADVPALVEQIVALERRDWPTRWRLIGRWGRCAAALDLGRSAQALDIATAGQAIASRHELPIMASLFGMFLVNCQLALGDVDAAALSAHALVTRSRGHPRCLLWSLGSLARSLLERQDAAQARTVLVEFLGRSREAGWDFLTLFAETFGALALAEGRPRAAARLAGHAARFYDGDGRRFPGRRLHVAVVQRLTALLAADEIAALAKTGDRLGEDEVCHWTLTRED